jgi:hypothetical protein
MQPLVEVSDGNASHLSIANLRIEKRSLEIEVCCPIERSLRSRMLRSFLARSYVIATC